MEVIIDTNILYAISKIELSDKDITILISELKKYDNIIVSDLSLMELLIKYRKNPKKIIQVKNFIAENKMAVHKFIPGNYSFVELINDEVINNNKYFNILLQRVFELKIKTETDIFLFWFSAIVSILNAVMFKVEDLPTGNSKKIFILQNKELVFRINDKNGDVYKEIQKYLRAFYRNMKESQFKDNIMELFFKIVEISILNYEAAKVEKTTSYFMNCSNNENEEYFQNIDRNVFYGRLLKRKNSKKEIIWKCLSPQLDEVVIFFQKKLGPKIGDATAKYYSILFKKILSLEGKKFSKNDAIDSLFFKYIDKYTLLTFDKNLRDSIKIISPDIYDENIRILTLCTKCA